jgi:hypothetical protein
MKRHPGLIRLSKEHHDGLILAQILKKDAPVYKGMPSSPEGKREYTLHFFKTELIKHFEVEERILIPEIKDHNNKIDKLCDKVLDQHKKLNSYIEKLLEDDAYEEILNQFGILLESHIRMEERELFEEIQKQFDDEFLNRLEAKLS